MFCHKTYFWRFSTRKFICPFFFSAKSSRPFILATSYICNVLIDYQGIPKIFYRYRVPLSIQTDIGEHFRVALFFQYGIFRFFQAVLPMPQAVSDTYFVFGTRVKIIEFLFDCHGLNGCDFMGF